MRTQKMNAFIYMIPLIGFLVSCNAPKNKEIKSELIQPRKDSIQIDSFYIDESEISSNRYREFHACPFDKFIQNPKTPQLAKDIYLDNEWDLNNDSEALALLDSLTATDNYSRPFYFKVVTLTYDESDGYFSEGLGYAGKEYVENHTSEFASHFDNKQCFSDDDLMTWVNIVMLEIDLVAHNEFDNSIIDSFIKNLNERSTDCSKNQKETLRKFILNLEQEWKRLL